MRRIGTVLAAALGAAVGLAPLQRVNGFEHQLKSGRYTRSPADRHSSTSFKPHGAQERARRMRQIAAGTLTASNGLVRGPNFPKVNSHGRVERGR